MRKALLISLSAMLILVVSGCESPQSVKPPPPPAWLMQEPANSIQTLDELISVSESN